MTQEIEFLSERTKSKQLFSNQPVIHFSTDKEKCKCDKKLKVLKTRTKQVVTLEIGRFTAHETIKYCKSCGNPCQSDELRKLVPYQGNFGFDVIVYIGESMFVHHCSDAAIKATLEEKNISLSLREISFLGKRYITYLALAHHESSDQIKHHLQLQGGYILHLDGSCEGGSPHLFSSMDGLSKIVLHNIKVSSENSKYIIPFLEEITSRYGEPIAVVSDMSSAIISSVETVFPGMRIVICHFHFLRDIGKDLLNTEYSRIRNILSAHKIYAALRKVVRELKCVIDESENFKNTLVSTLI